MECSSVSINAKQLCDDGHVKFDESKAIWVVNDCEEWFLVTVFAKYGCSCVDTPSCCHVLAVKSKLGMQIKKFTYKPTQLSAIIVVVLAPQKSLQMVLKGNTKRAML